MPCLIETAGTNTKRRMLLVVAIAICIYPPAASAQDTRHVVEPKLPQVCASLVASLTSQAGKLPEESERHLDTERIQQAIDHCVAGRAVELRPDGTHNAFLSGPLELKPSVTLLVAAGATLFGTRNPRHYDLNPGSCGVVNQEGHGCKPLIHVAGAPHSGVMGLGTIDGQGGATLLGQGASWWDLAHQAKVEDKKQNCPRIIVVDSSDDFTLYGITLRNSPNFHVIVNRTNGFTAWGVRIDAPATARNTDGIDPASSTNVTIAYSYIRAGDDNVAIKAGKTGPATHMTIAHNHFYSGHGMSIGSETDGGASAIRVSDLTIDGADNGLRIKSDRSRGGLVHDVSYQNVCMRDVKNPIVLDPFYSDASGDRLPVYEDVILQNVHDIGSGKLTLVGFDAQHLLKVNLDGVYIDGVRAGQVKAEHARFLVGPNGTNIKLQGSDIEVRSQANQDKPISCKDAFVPFPDIPVVNPQTQSASDLYPEQASPVFGTKHIVTVAADKSGDYQTVQEGIDALTTTGGTVFIKPGVYREVLHMAKPHLRMEGTGSRPDEVTIVFGNSAYSSGSTFKSATVFVTADDFYATNLTFQNDFSKNHEAQVQGAQALALSVTADRAVFRHVRILGAQDTLYAASRSCKSEDGPCIPTRQYFEDCYVEGHVDFIFGDSQAVFDHCIIHAIAHPTVMLTAQSKHYPSEPSGYVFDHCKVTSDPAVGKIYLGRPWRTYATVIFLESELDGKVDPAGWSEWHAEETRRLETAFYAEYHSTGPGANPAKRESYSKQLSPSDADKYKAAHFLAGTDGWDPSAVK
jgi:polygalacturonase